MYELQQEIIRLKKEKDICILAHSYQAREIVEVADFTGDSFQLSVMAEKAPNKNVIMCGVRFMAETVKLLSPEKTVYLANPIAGCPMAEQMDKELIEGVKEKYPDYTVVAYINTTTDLKTVCDVCVTSSSAVKIVKKLPQKNILFIPDCNLGDYVSKQVPEKNFKLLSGGCPIHARVSARDAKKAREMYPNAEILVHPECTPDVVALADFVGSTSAIMNYAKQSDKKDGTILEQDVKAGDTVKRGSQINVVIAGKGDSTSEMVKIPSVIGKTKSSAKSTLESAGFSVTFEYGDYNDSVAADVVTAQSPSAKKQAAKGSTVTVTLSPGQKPITVPNVVGASQSHAESALAGAGLKYTYADSQYSDTVPAGSVISQTKSGETVAAGTTITLTLSKGKQEISTNVSKGISYSGEGTVVKAEYKLVGKSGTVYDKGSYENTSSFTVSGTMKEATGSIVVTWTVQTGETDEAGNPATVTLDPVTYSVP